MELASSTCCSADGVASGHWLLLPGVFPVPYADYPTVLQMVEKSVGQVDLCSAESMLQIIKDLQSLKEAG